MNAYFMYVFVVWLPLLVFRISTIYHLLASVLVAGLIRGEGLFFEVGICFEYVCQFNFLFNI